MTDDTECKSLWQLLWEHDPNGLIVVDADMYIKLANPAFCQLFQVEADAVVEQPISTILDNVEDFKNVWQTGKVLRDRFYEHPDRQLYVSQILFPIEEESVVVCIAIDVSHDIERRRELKRLKQETVRQVNEVVDNQMKAVQEIAGLLGETTAETKISLLKIIQAIEQEGV
ncbi:MAG: PAS domain-containing protein [Spirulinaceae cyanobacterium RM2_2_10]|nr:PAS domain-containing protein [Spirulinaceae cyanobacterium SM2_1_0]NJO20990.1 PAS domain-containing protein [Spirulinaceae cyanobacterium RM2_2_10]